MFIYILLVSQKIQPFLSDSWKCQYLAVCCLDNWDRVGQKRRENHVKIILLFNTKRWWDSGTLLQCYRRHYTNHKMTTWVHYQLSKTSWLGWVWRLSWLWAHGLYRVPVSRSEARWSLAKPWCCYLLLDIFWLVSVKFLFSLSHRTALLVVWPLKPAVSSDRSIPAWQSHKMWNT